MPNTIKVKKANFYYIIDNKFNSFVSTVTGYGIVNSVNNIRYGEILNPTGMQPAVFYTTGLLTGNVSENDYQFSWVNIQLSGTGQSGKVYLNYITGYQPAQNIVEFIDSTGFGLQDGDIININNYEFTFSNENSSPAVFTSPQNLINIFNSGSTGAFNEIGFDYLESIIGITGYQENNKLFLFSYLRSGEDGNSIKIYNNIENPYVIKIYSRYFTGGKTFRPLTNFWTGNFNNIINLTVENSGFYNFNQDLTPVFGFASGIDWVNEFSGNYIINTGIFDPRDRDNYSGVIINYNSGLNQYYGQGLIPSGFSNIFTGLKIEITKNNFYNVSGNLAKYTLSGIDFIFTGIIEG